MGIQELRQKAKREAAAEAEKVVAKADAQTAKAARAVSHKVDGGAVRTATGVGMAAQIVRHPRFTLILAVWAAALGGLCVMALSSVDIARANMVLGLGVLGGAARLLYAAIAAFAGAVGGFAGALVLVRILKGGGPDRAHAALAELGVQPIDPTELGSDSLDAPLDDFAFSGAAALDERDPFNDKAEDAYTNAPTPEGRTPADPAPTHGWEGEEIDWSQAVCSDEPLPARLHVPLAHDESTAEIFELGPFALAPQGNEGCDEGCDESCEGAADTGLDLDAFTAILAEERHAFEARRNAAERARCDAAPLGTQPAPTSVARLREVPPDQLSLIQLVERFAAALHDAQARSPEELQTRQIARGNVDREAALAKALKTLEMFTDRGTDTTGGESGASAAGSDQAAFAALDDTERDLRDALTRLQSMRGAA